jgi:membrane-associated phospholipid phosphatase
MTVLLASAMLAESSAAFAGDPDRVEWSPDWPRFRLVEAIDTLALAVGAYVINAYWKPPEHAAWSSGILWDKAVRDALRGQTLGVQRTASNVSNYLYLGAVVAPLVIDNAVVALAVHRSPDVALQMTLIDAQALAMAGAVSLATEHAVGRARPYTTSCGPDGVVRDASGHPLLWSCGNSGDFQSFYSGHAAVTATMAGLTCVHHEHLPLYGGGFADLAPCLLMIGVSTATGIARIVADRHWSTDVITGWSVGFVSGYVVPSLLHYGFNHGRPLGEVKVAGVQVVPVPEVYAGGAGLALAGIY